MMQSTLEDPEPYRSGAAALSNTDTFFVAKLESLNIQS